MADIPSIPGRDQNTSSGSARYRSASAQISAITIVLARLDEAERLLREWLATPDGDCPTPSYPDSGGQIACGKCVPCRARGFLEGGGDNRA